MIRMEKDLPLGTALVTNVLLALTINGEPIPMIAADRSGWRCRATTARIPLNG